MEDLQREFLNPTAAWRGKPFWSWNGDLDEAELIRQVHVLKEMGMGGFFMHSRTGLITEYLGDEWFRLINACADEAERLGMEAWLYDEDRWPSGTAGGLVTENPEHRLHFVRLSMVSASEFTPDGISSGFLAAFTCRLAEDGLQVTGVRRFTPEDSPAFAEDETVLLFSVEEMGPSSFYNGFTYVDTMSRAATDAYIQITHERYRQRCGDRLGRSIRGIFTDEPHRGAMMTGFSVPNPDPKYCAPWTTALPDLYRARFGGDLITDLPELFLQVDGRAVSPVKWRYMELTQQLFLENFLRPLYEWCETHNLRLTGHVLHEDSLTSQAAMQGSMMRSYEWMHDPGIDILTEGNRCFWAAKQLQSAAHQLGREWLLSELYGCTGWQFDFSAHKAVGDWQALLGINLRCHHLSWYTMGGEAKRDYPASIFHQSAWWQDYDAAVETYFSRLGLLLGQGERVCDVLVLNPIESVNCQIHAGWANTLSPITASIQALEAQYRELFGWLTGALIDFDYGDEEMLSRLAPVESDGVFRVGKASYRTIVVGGMTTIRSSTLALLRAFAERGGKVVFAGEPPSYMDALPSDEAGRLAASAVSVEWNREAVCGAIMPGAGTSLDVTRASTGEPVTALLSQIRRDGDRWIVALLNTDRESGVGPVHIRFRTNADAPPVAVTEWDCRAGERRARLAEAVEEGISWQTTFAPGGEHVYVLSAAPDPTAASPARNLPVIDEATCDGPYAYTLNEPNVLVLDMAEWRIGETGEWHSPLEVLKIDQSVRDAFDLPHRSGHMVQPWYHRWKEGNNETPTTLDRVTLRFTFEVETIPAGPLYLAVERPDRWVAAVNGVPLDAAPDGWWCDIAFARLPIPNGAIRPGANEVTLTTEFSAELNIEAAYLLGNFGVRLTDDATRAVLIGLPTHLTPGDLTAQGLPFYGGLVTLTVPLPRPPATGESLQVVLPEGIHAACTKIVSPSMPPVYLAFPPFRAECVADMATLATDGTGATLTLEVALTRRNTFGPLHQVPLRTGAYGPGNWVTGGTGWSDTYQLWPSGMPVGVEVRYLG